MNNLINNILINYKTTENTENIIHFSKIKNSISFRKNFSEIKIVDKLNNLNFYLHNLDKHRINIMMEAYEIGCYYEHLKNYDKAFSFYKLSANIGHPKSCLCLMTLYYQLDDINSYNFYKYKVDFFFSIFENKRNHFTEEVMKDYLKLYDIKVELDAINTLNSLGGNFL